MQTCRDARIVAWLSLMGAAGAEHVAGWFGMSRSSAYARLAVLAADGLVERRTVLHRWPGMYSASAAGLRWQGFERLTVYRVKPGGFEHAWRVATVAVELHRRLADWRVMGEREIRLAEAEREGLLASAQVGRVAGHAVLHRPDLALVSPSGRVTVVEVELSVKSAGRLAAICRGWGRARHLAHVYYLAEPQAARAVKRAVQATRAGELVSVLAREDLDMLARCERDMEEASHALAV